MKLTQNDAHICRILFNKETHPMALAMYGDRAREIYDFICNEIIKRDFFNNIVWSFHKILRDKITQNFFFENNLVDFSTLSRWDISRILVYSAIAEKIWDSGELDPYLHKLNDSDIKYILGHSIIRQRIKFSGKLKLA